MNNRWWLCLILIGFFISQAAAESCNLNLPYSMFIQDRQLVIKQEGAELLRITADNQLLIRGQPQTLTEQQQRLVARMGKEYRSLLPEIAALATKASTIAIKAVTASVQALLGSDAELSDSINRRIDQLGQRLKEEIELRQRMGHYQQLEQLGESLDAELEAMVDELVANLDGKTLLTSLFQVLSADEEELSDLELRIDMLEQDLEWQLEQQSEALAKAAKQVCDRIEQLDKLEAQLQNQLPAYQGIDLIVPPNAD